MRRVTRVVDEDMDLTLWYVDGTYIGRDEQIDVAEIVECLGGETIHADLSQQRPDLLSELVR